MPRIHPEGTHSHASARRPLSLALLLAVAVGVVGTLALFGFESRARHGLEREALAQQAARASGLASELGSQLHASEQLLNSLASLVSPVREQHEVEEVMRRMFLSAPTDAIHGLGVWFEPGQLVPGVRHMGPYIHGRLDARGETLALTYEWSTPAYDYHQRDWYQRAKQLGGGIFLSEPYFDVDQTYESLVRAFFDPQGQLRGVVSVDLRLPQVREVVRRANGSRAEILYLVSGAGMLLAHPEEKRLLAWAHARGQPVRSLSEITLADLRAWEHEHGMDGKWRTTQVPVPHAGWKVFASTHEGTLFAAVHYQRGLVVALGMVLWAGLGASGLAMARAERARSLRRTLTIRQRQEEERRRLLAQVRQRSAELQAILESMVDAVIVTDARGRVTLANRAALALFGESSFEGLSIEAAYRAQAPEGLEGQELPFETLPLNRALRGEQVSDTDLVITLPQQNRKRVLRTNAAPIRGDAGQVIAAVAVVRDITQATELEHLQREFVRMAAHELKTPLAVMKSYAQLASRTEDPTPTLRRLLEGICRGTERMDRVVRTLLDASQLQLGRLRFEKEEVELRALVEAVAARTAANHPRNPIHVRAGPDAMVRGDRARLEQVLTELLDNAARYSPAGHPVEVSLDLDADEVELRIQDEGIGIPENRRDQLFERFYRAHGGTPHDRGGMGLGLYLSRGIIQHHGGHLELESQEGEGTLVRFRLPRLTDQRMGPSRHDPTTEQPSHPAG